MDGIGFAFATVGGFASASDIKHDPFQWAFKKSPDFTSDKTQSLAELGSVHLKFD
jgi:hypothetical protein